MKTTKKTAVTSQVAAITETWITEWMAAQSATGRDGEIRRVRGVSYVESRDEDETEETEPCSACGAHIPVDELCVHHRCRACAEENSAGCCVEGCPDNEAGERGRFVVEFPCKKHKG